MPLVRRRHGVDCDCCAPTAAAESLDEVAFAKSAAAAASRGDLAAVRAIVARQPAQVHNDGYGGSSGYTPLHYAAREGHADVAEFLLASGADINAATRSGGAAPLHRAAYTGRAGVVRLLLRHGADLSLQDADGQTAAHKAAAGGHQDVLAVLLAAAPGLEHVRDSRGRTAADLLAPG
eukprot:scaffold1.g5549.t1